MTRIHGKLWRAVRLSVWNKALTHVPVFLVQGVTFQTACFKDAKDTSMKNEASSSDLHMSGATSAAHHWTVNE